MHNNAQALHYAADNDLMSPLFCLHARSCYYVHARQ